MWLKWLPWKYIVRQAARRQGFIDPIALMARFNALAQPAETAAPLELLRAGAVLHARGFLNNNVIQHNLDWVWPYWVDRQFDPTSPAFIPRAFSMTHINLTQRNWTAVGYPGCPETPLVDARGLLMPFFDSWSVDAWFLADDGTTIIPSRLKTVRQSLSMGETGDALRVETVSTSGKAVLRSTVEVVVAEGEPWCRADYTVDSPVAGWLVVSVRPYNPEGVSFVNDLSLLTRDEGWEINQTRTVHFSRPPDEHLVSRYRDGDVYLAIREGRFNRRAHIRCEVGMVTGAALYRIEADAAPAGKPSRPHGAGHHGKGRPGQVSLMIPLMTSESDAAEKAAVSEPSPDTRWRAALTESAPFEFDAEGGVGHEEVRYRFLYEAALRTTILLSPRAVYAGPYTYKRFWYRDATIILHALMCAGHRTIVERALDYCVEGQTLTGYFKSQDGEWDSNGQVLWAMGRYCRLFGVPPKREWMVAIRKGIHWIRRKRLGVVHDKPTSGLLPAGFSAEHLGPNDYYYWDDFWTVSGLRMAEEMLRSTDDDLDVVVARDAAREAESLMRAIEESLAMVAARTGSPAMPASPYRRMDSGAVGSIAVGFPLQLWPRDDQRILATVEYLLDECSIDDGFYHDINHSGINPYLTLHIAQCLLRARDPRFRNLMRAIARIATETGQWPEAVHPQLGTGCMGDGQHAWAAAEWLMMIRNCFVYEEEFEDVLVVGAGLSPEWCGDHGLTSLGPVPTRFGPVTVALEHRGDDLVLSWRGEWFDAEPSVDVGSTPEGWMVAHSAPGRCVYRRVADTGTTADERRPA